MINIISSLFIRLSQLRNNFWSCATRHFMKRRFNNLFEFYLPTTHTFREKLLLKKGSILGNKDLALGSVIEGIPNRFLRVSYEDAFFRFGFEFIRLKFLHINITSPNFKK